MNLVVVGENGIRGPMRLQSTLSPEFLRLHTPLHQIRAASQRRSLSLSPSRFKDRDDEAQPGVRSRISGSGMRSSSDDSVLGQSSSAVAVPVSAEGIVILLRSINNGAQLSFHLKCKGSITMNATLPVLQSMTREAKLLRDSDRVMAFGLARGKRLEVHWWKQIGYTPQDFEDIEHHYSNEKAAATSNNNSNSGGSGAETSKFFSMSSLSEAVQYSRYSARKKSPKRGENEFSRFGSLIEHQYLALEDIIGRATAPIYVEPRRVFLKSGSRSRSPHRIQQQAMPDPAPQHAKKSSASNKKVVLQEEQTKPHRDPHRYQNLQENYGKINSSSTSHLSQSITAAALASVSKVQHTLGGARTSPTRKIPDISQILERARLVESEIRSSLARSQELKRAEEASVTAVEATESGESSKGGEEAHSDDFSSATSSEDMSRRYRKLTPTVMVVAAGGGDENSNHHHQGDSFSPSSSSFVSAATSSPPSQRQSPLSDSPRKRQIQILEIQVRQLKIDNERMQFRLACESRMRLEAQMQAKEMSAEVVRLQQMLEASQRQTQHLCILHASSNMQIQQNQVSTNAADVNGASSSSPPLSSLSFTYPPFHPDVADSELNKSDPFLVFNSSPVLSPSSLGAAQ